MSDAHAHAHGNVGVGVGAGAILRRQRGAVAPFRRDRRSNDARAVSPQQAVAIPIWGRIVLRTATTTLR